MHPPTHPRPHPHPYSIAAHGEHHIECAPAYVEYAVALLRKAQAEGDPFGGAAPIQKEGEGEGSSSAPADDDEDDEDGDENEEGEGEAESDDLELSFQCFEVARLIYEKAGAAHELSLADVLELLGEVAMENEMWEDAIGELERSVAIKARLLPASSRQLAHLHYQLATATVAQSEKARHDAAEPPPGPEEPQASDAPPPLTAEQCAVIVTRCREQAIGHYQRAANVLELRLESLRPAGNGKAKADAESDESAELAELLSEVRAKVEEQQQALAKGDGPLTAVAAAVSGDAGGAAGAGVTTIGFGMPEPTKEGVTTIGFGAPAESSGFAAPSQTTLPVKNLGVVGRGAKRIRLDGE
jgi:hypothetical protein